jgi:hypothetical protein
MALIFSGSGNPVTIDGVDQGLTLTRMTAQASTSGTSVDFTGIPSWAQRITVMFDGVSESSGNPLYVQLGTSGGIVSTSYASGSTIAANSNVVSGTTATNGFILQVTNSTAQLTGHMIITLLGSNKWISSHVIGRTDAGGAALVGGGSVTLGGSLNSIRLTGTTNTLDNGNINVMYE